jgi:hypothetical protein
MRILIISPTFTTTENQQQDRDHPLSNKFSLSMPSKLILSPRFRSSNSWDITQMRSDPITSDALTRSLSAFSASRRGSTRSGSFIVSPSASSCATSCLHLPCTCDFGLRDHRLGWRTRLLPLTVIDSVPPDRRISKSLKVSASKLRSISLSLVSSSKSLCVNYGEHIDSEAKRQLVQIGLGARGVVTLKLS